MNNLEHNPKQNKNKTRNKKNNIQSSKDEVILDEKYFNEIRENLKKVLNDRAFYAMLLHKAKFFI